MVIVFPDLTVRAIECRRFAPERPGARDSRGLKAVPYRKRYPPNLPVSRTFGNNDCESRINQRGFSCAPALYRLEGVLI